MGYKVVVVSNFDSRVYEVCTNLNIIDLFDDFIISSETGYAKPDPQIYKFALEKNNLTPEQCIFIGDNYINDYTAPRNLGINALLLNRENENNSHNAEKISNLNVLISLLQNNGRPS